MENEPHDWIDHGVWAISQEGRYILSKGNKGRWKLTEWANYELQSRQFFTAGSEQAAIAEANRRTQHAAVGAGGTR